MSTNDLENLRDMVELSQYVAGTAIEQADAALAQRDRAIDVIRELVRVRMAPMTQEIPPAEYNAAWQAARELLAGRVVAK